MIKSKETLEIPRVLQPPPRALRNVRIPTWRRSRIECHLQLITLSPPPWILFLFIHPPTYTTLYYSPIIRSSFNSSPYFTPLYDMMCLQELTHPLSSTDCFISLAKIRFAPPTQQSICNYISCPGGRTSSVLAIGSYYNYGNYARLRLIE